MECFFIAIGRRPCYNAGIHTRPMGRKESFMKLEINPLYAEHLQCLVQLPTISTTNDEHTDWSHFAALHHALAKFYPLIHQNAEKTLIGNGSLLFHWKSAHPVKAPLLLMAHQDVVPAGDASKWTHGPFSGDIDEGCLWGRGTTDCKSILMSEMEAVEALMAEGFAPDFDIYLAFGHNEEVHADPHKKGARLIAEHLKKAGVRLSLLFDEGGDMECGHDLGYAADLAYISLGEKSSCDYLLWKDGPGGHSSMPGASTLIGDVARAVTAVEDHPLPYRLTPLVRAQLKAFSVLQKGVRKEIFADPDSHWEELTAIARNERDIDALLRTTSAVTMASGGEQSNVLPSHAEALVNCRLLQRDTKEAVLRHIRQVISPDVKVKLLSGEDPQTPTSTDSPEFTMVKDVIRSLYGAETIILPALLSGGTDARYYSDVCSHIFRFGGMYWTRDWGAAHQVDEKIPVNVLSTGVRFFQAVIRAYQEKDRK